MSTKVRRNVFQALARLLVIVTGLSWASLCLAASDAELAHVSIADIQVNAIMAGSGIVASIAVTWSIARLKKADEDAISELRHEQENIKRLLDQLIQRK